jgi:hypothetical protein
MQWSGQWQEGGINGGANSSCAGKQQMSDRTSDKRWKGKALKNAQSKHEVGMECSPGAGLGGLRLSTEPLGSWMWRTGLKSSREREGDAGARGRPLRLCCWAVAGERYRGIMQETFQALERIWEERGVLEHQWRAKQRTNAQCECSPFQLRNWRPAASSALQAFVGLCKHQMRLCGISSASLPGNALGCAGVCLAKFTTREPTRLDTGAQEPFRAVAQAFVARFVQSGANLPWPSHSIIVISASLRTRTTATDPHRQP